MVGAYDQMLVALSVLIACLASYAALSLAARAGGLAAPKEREPWLLAGALMMGLAIWSMHFIGMLAFRLPIAVGHDPLLSALSGLLATLVSLYALHRASQPRLTLRTLVGSGVAMGGGVALMHYLGMAALKMQPAIQYQPLPFFGSVLIAMLASVAALYLLHQATQARSRRWIRPLAGLFMGLAISGMHYTGMAAARFAEGSYCGAVGGLDRDSLALAVGLSSALAVLAALFSAWFDHRLQQRTENLRRRLDRVSGEVERLQHFDPVTGLLNRRQLNRRLSVALHRRRVWGTRLALLYFDLDGFTPINRVLGQASGDQILREMARRLRSRCGADELLGRAGNDEYVLLLDPAPDAQALATRAAQLLACLREPLWLGGRELRLSASLGVSLAPDHAHGADLLQKAQIAMIEAQRRGRDTWRYYDPQLDVQDLDTLELLADLHKALEQGGLWLAYQPKVLSRSRELHSVEALLRWSHPRLGEISPARFVPLAERHGLVVELGDWVLAEACRQASVWRRQGLCLPIAINFSPMQFRDPDLPDRIRAGLAIEGLDSSALSIEITESTVMADEKLARSSIRALAGDGLRISIDDFGTGYSSLARLRELPVRELKMDRAFLEGLGSLDSARAVIEAIVGLAHSLGMELVAEGVETAAQARLLRELGCDLLQGFYFSPGLRAEALVRLALARRALHGEAEPEVPLAQPA